MSIFDGNQFSFWWDVSVDVAAKNKTFAIAVLESFLNGECKTGNGSDEGADQSLLSPDGNITKCTRRRVGGEEGVGAGGGAGLAINGAYYRCRTSDDVT